MNTFQKVVEKKIDLWDTGKTNDARHNGSQEISMHLLKKPTSHFLRLSFIVSFVFASFGAVGPQGCGGEESADVYYYEESEPVYDDVNYEGDWILRNVENEEEEESAEDASSQESEKNSTRDNDLVEA